MPLVAALAAVTFAAAAPPPCPDPATIPVPAGARRVEILPELAPACAAVEVDLDGDGTPDPVTVTEAPELPAVFRVAARLSTQVSPDDDGWRSLTSIRALDDEPRAWTALYAKPPGVPVLRDTLPKPDQRALERTGAVEVCSPAVVDAGGRPPTVDPTTICHCTTWYWWEKGKPRTLRACD